jgi:hypothetical protein
MNNAIKFSHHSRSIKAAFVAICIVFISSCVSTDEAQDSENLVDINGQLAELLIQADANNNRSEKPEIESFAVKAYTKAKELEGQQQVKLALGFYQAASQAFWRDDIAANNASIFEIAEKVEQLCADLGDQAPDRDCFVSPLIEHIASVDMITFNPKLTLPGTGVSESMALSSRALLLDLGKKSNDEVGFANGALTNLMNYAVANQSVLNNHPELNVYVCSNLVSVFGTYVRGVFGLEDYYKQEGAGQQVNIEDEHPIFKTFFESVGTEGTLPERVTKFVNMQVPSCAS